MVLSGTKQPKRERGAILSNGLREALEVRFQSRIINPLENVEDSSRLTFPLICHDLSVVRHMADRVGVMRLG